MISGAILIRVYLTVDEVSEIEISERRDGFTSVGFHLIFELKLVMYSPAV